jgi:hypothetical protein|tara:strand:+ start:191 stop:571 length:381 start_codon:yes stop_codon:yes gene_type:complete
MNEVKIGSNKSFGIVFFGVFFIIALYPLIYDNQIRVWALFISLFFLVLGLKNSKLLNPLNKIWFRFGMLLGKIISPLVMSVIFFTVVTPISVIMKILKKDLLRLKFNDSETYWIKIQEKKKMKNQF